MRWLIVLAMLFPFPVFCGEPELSTGQLLYVPVYSHIYIGDKERSFNLAVTLSIRNTDPANGMRLTSVDYYDTSGALVRRYLSGPAPLGPLASIRYVVGEQDTKGGSGANFLVRWEAPTPINPPIVETVMVGAQSGQGISFTSQAKEIKE